MQTRNLGKTGLKVGCLGLGGAEVGDPSLELSHVSKFLNTILDLGINLIDTGACYGNSEEVIGKTISNRRNEYTLITKCGHHVEDSDPDSWDSKIVRISAERSLKRMRTDFLDVLLFHSCDYKQLQDDSLIDELVKCKKDGLCRFIGFSGDDKDLFTAIDMDVFECIEVSVNILDQQVIEKVLPRTKQLNLGVIAKRIMANACWLSDDHFSEGMLNYTQPYRDRFNAMKLTSEKVGFDGDIYELATRFAVFQDGVSCAIAGGQNLKHVQTNIQNVNKGPLPDDVIKNIRDLWHQHDDGSWIGKT